MVDEGGWVVDDGAGVVHLVDGYVLLVLESDAGVVDMVGDYVLLVEERWGREEIK
jgi:hypothetical protein